MYFAAIYFPGTVQNSAPLQYFKDSGIGLFNDMFNYMEGRETNVKSSDDGVTRVVLTAFSDF